MDLHNPEKKKRNSNSLCWNNSWLIYLFHSNRLNNYHIHHILRASSNINRVKWRLVRKLKCYLFSISVQTKENEIFINNLPFVCSKNILKLLKTFEIISMFELTVSWILVPFWDLRGKELERKPGWELTTYTTKKKTNGFIFLH